MLDPNLAVREHAMNARQLVEGTARGTAQYGLDSALLVVAQQSEEEYREGNNHAQSTAFQNAYLTAFKALLEAGANPNANASIEHEEDPVVTILHTAETLKLFLNAGASLPDPDGEELGFMFEHGVDRAANYSTDYLRVLLDAGVSPDTDYGGITAIQYAMLNIRRKRVPELVKLLMDYHADISVLEPYEIKRLKLSHGDYRKMAQQTLATPNEGT